MKDRINFALVMIFLITFLGYLISALQVMPRKDEIEYLWRAQALVNGQIEISPQHNYFFSIVLSIGFFVFGENLVVAQSISAFIGALVVIPSYLLAQELFKDKIHARELGLVTAMLVSLTLMPFSVEIRNDLLFLLFFIFFCFYIVKSISETKYLKIAGFFNGLAFLARDQGILIIPVLIVYFFVNELHHKSYNQNVISRAKQSVNRELLLAIITFFLVIMPKLFWKWYFFGDPFYIRNSNFWLDNYEDKYNTAGFISQSKFQPSMSNYIKTHTVQQMAERWLLGAYRIIEKLQGQLLLPVLGLALIGLLLFRKRRAWILHLNISIWFVVLSWLFGIRPTTRWIIPLFPLLLIPATATVMELAVRVVELIKTKLMTTQKKFPQMLWLKRLPFDMIQNCKRTMRFIRVNLSSKRFISFLIACFVIIFIPLFAFRTGQIYEQSVPSQEYQALLEMVDWVTINTAEDSLFMTRDGNDLIFYYAHRESVITPNGNLSFILKVIHDLNVDYLIIDSGTLHLRPALVDIFTGIYIPPGFSLVYWNFEDELFKNSNTLEIKIFLTGI